MRNLDLDTVNWTIAILAITFLATVLLTLSYREEAKRIDMGLCKFDVIGSNHQVWKKCQ